MAGQCRTAPRAGPGRYARARLSGPLWPGATAHHMAGVHYIPDYIVLTMRPPFLVP
jgi:hypothetical protein